MQGLARLVAGALFCFALAACTQPSGGRQPRADATQVATVLEDFLVSVSDNQDGDRPDIRILGESVPLDLSAVDLAAVNEAAESWSDASSPTLITAALWDAFVGAQAETMRLDALGAQLPPGTQFLVEEEYVAGLLRPTGDIYAYVSTISCSADEEQALLYYEQANRIHGIGRFVLLKRRDAAWAIVSVFPWPV